MLAQCGIFVEFGKLKGYRALNLEITGRDVDSNIVDIQLDTAKIWCAIMCLSRLAIILTYPYLITS